MSSAEKSITQSRKPLPRSLAAKVSDKILIIENLERATDIIIGGGMAYTFFKAQGGHIGNSLCEEDRIDTALEILKSRGRKVFVYTCLLILSLRTSLLQMPTSSAPSNNIPEGWMGLDIAEHASEQFSNVIKRSKTIYGTALWVFLK